MREQAQEQLNTLRDEFKAGQEIQADLESRLASVRHTLVRISGAIQILEELLKSENPSFSELRGSSCLAATENTD